MAATGRNVLCLEAAGLALGLLTRLAALGIAVVMLVAILTVHREHGFCMNWFGNQRGEGFEPMIELFSHARQSQTRQESAKSVA